MPGRCEVGVDDPRVSEMSDYTELHGMGKMYLSAGFGIGCSTCGEVCRGMETALGSHRQQLRGDAMDEETTETTLGIDRYVQMLRRQWGFVALLTIVGIVGAIAYLQLAPREYTASTTVNLTVISTEPFAGRSAPSSLLDEQEEQAIARSHVVAALAADTPGLGMDAAEIREASTVSTSSGAAVVTVSFTASSAETAVAGADGVASSYLSYRKERATERITQLVTGLGTRIDDLTGQIAQIDTKLVDAENDAVSTAQLETERSRLIAELDGLLTERNGLQSVDTAPGVVLSSAGSGPVSVSPSGRSTLMTGAAAGLVLGIILAVVRDLRDRRLRDAQEVSRALGAPILSELESDLEEIPAEGEAAGALRVARERMLTEIAEITEAAEGALIVVVDASHAEHVSAAALNLAVVTAQSGREVQLMAPEDPWRTRTRLDAVFEQGGEVATMAATGGSLRFFGASDDHEESQPDLLITTQTDAAIAAAGEGTLTFLVLTIDAYHASILAALRRSQSVIVLAREYATTAAEIAWLREEARVTGTPILGAVLEESTRRQARRRRARRRSPRAGKPAHRRSIAATWVDDTKAPTETLPTPAV